MKLSIAPIDEPAVRAVATWRYDPPYDFYNLSDDPDEIEAFVVDYLDPELAVHMLHDEAGNLVAFCSFGEDAQVPGGDYSADALDVGLGIRPDLTGRKLGGTIAQVVLKYASAHFHPAGFRVTIAAFNQRALTVWQRLGFAPIQTFTSTFDGLRYHVLRKIE